MVLELLIYAKSAIKNFEQSEAFFGSHITTMVPLSLHSTAIWEISTGTNLILETQKPNYHYLRWSYRQSR